MDRDPSSENKDLRRRLTAVIANARHNEERMRRFHEQELQLLSASGLVDLLRHIVVGHRQVFELQSVTLTLIDAEYEFQRLLAELGCSDCFPEVRFVDSGAGLAAFFGSAQMPRLGEFRADRHAELFHVGPPPASVAVLPLLRQRRLLGSLNLGSQAAGRFIPGSATDFLERLGAVVAIGLENAINHERLKHIGLIDALTGVHNRRYFDRRLTEEVERVQRSGQPLTCLFLDVDHFKKVNDVHGHQVGDRVLQEVAARVKAQLRLSDALGRYGGEEFSALLVQTDLEQATDIAERIRASIAGEPFRLGGAHDLRVTMSVGIAVLLPQDCAGAIAACAERLVALADEAVYRAKQGGRNRVEIAGKTAAGPL
jgi:diguanylate cyclase (GGDEF) domain